MLLRIGSILVSVPLITGGCSSQDGSGSLSSAGGQADVSAGAGGQPATGPEPQGGAEAGGANGGGGGSDAPGNGEGGGTAEPQFGLPCEVEQVLEAKCQRCHDDPRQNGAPFPLLTWEDTRRRYGTPQVYELMPRAIETEYMPLMILGLTPPVESLTQTEKAVLLDWLEGGAEPVPRAGCD